MRCDARLSIDPLVSWRDATTPSSSIFCSEALGRRAVARLGVPVSVVVTAERAGAYKPDPRPYALGIEELKLPAARVLFVAGSPFDVPGATRAGMPVLWHNRLGLARAPGSPAPLVELATLDTLPDWLGVGASPEKSATPQRQGDFPR